MDVGGNPLDITRRESPALAPELQSEPGPRRRRRWLWVALVIALLAIGGGIYLYLRKPNVQKDTQTSPPPPTEETPTANTSSKDVYVTSTAGLNLRSDPSTDGTILTVIPYGATLEKLDTSSDGKWFKFTYKTQTGWSSADYISADKPPLPEVHDADFVANGAVDLRGGTAKPVIFKDLTGDGKDEAIVIVEHAKLKDYYVLGYKGYELIRYLERRDLVNLELKVESDKLTESTTSGQKIYRYNGTSLSADNA